MTDSETELQITTVILAGGKARRMGGQDKGLLQLAGSPLIEYVIKQIEPQVSNIIINANRHLKHYRLFNYPVIPDAIGDYGGPLVGIFSAMQICTTPWLLCVPCDSPFIPIDLVERFKKVLSTSNEDPDTPSVNIVIAHDGERLQPVFALLNCQLIDSLQDYLSQGKARIDTWYNEHHCVTVDFSDNTEIFINLNTPSDLQDAEVKLQQT